jgi:site-specific recombinase XerD
LGVVAKEEINPAVPDKKRVLVRLDKGGQNWYLRLRQHGRYRFISLKTPDLTEARRQAFLDPPEANEKQGRSIRRALLDFQESRQQLMDAPGENKGIRLNTFKTYKARVQALIEFFEYQQVANKIAKVKTVGSLTAGDFAYYRNWREKEGKMLTTIKTEISQINTILSWFADHEYIPKPIRIKLPSVDPKKYRQPNRLLTEEEEKVLMGTLKRLCSSGDPEQEKRWRLYAYWLEWLQDTFTRPHECRLLLFTDVREHIIDGKTAVQFRTRPETKTGERLVYASSNVKGKLLRLYESWRLSITPTSPLFLLPKGTPPSSSWYSDMWKKLITECGFKVQPRELTQYSLRHQGINALLVQGVPPTKVADLAGHSLSIQQRIYKKYSLEDDHSVLRDDTKIKKKRPRPLTTDADVPFPWEMDPQTGKWFPDDEDDM